MRDSIVVDFNRPIPLFPLACVSLLPHAVQGLHIFEPRYRQMVEDALRQMRPGNLLTAGPIAMATIGGQAFDAVGASPKLRPAVCVGQIVQHERLKDGRHNIVLHGVCRARIKEIQEPGALRAYRTALLQPIDPPNQTPPKMKAARKVLQELLHRPLLQKLASVKTVAQWADRADMPTHAVIELVGAAILRDEGTRYQLLACGNPWERAQLVAGEIAKLEGVVAAAEAQGAAKWPKGLSWN
ncbi:MAG: LON peptidase substrate-binding domain-containing protein [Planctomycetes bacterium]|nr:LON peptidase substrate-binding domain-containing protein [Planctomycetota bacterium]